MNSDQLKAEIKKRLPNLYFLKSEQVNNLSERIDYLPDDALKKVLEVLEDAKKKQNEFIKRAVSKDRHFNKKLESFVMKEFKGAADEVSQQESDEAESILDQLDDV